ncbi:diphthamide synthesis protein [Candidatus Woesearchaeota archaeon]|nr:diphthamide synthesis protein [Candidatus Woesearchaeota archaeon]
MYTIDYDAMITTIKESGAKRVMLQLPDGLKPKALDIQRQLASRTDAELLFWAGSNHGACDLPVGLEKLGVDLLIHLGHTEWVY